MRPPDELMVDDELPRPVLEHLRRIGHASQREGLDDPLDRGEELREVPAIDGEGNLLRMALHALYAICLDHQSHVGALRHGRLRWLGVRGPGGQSLATSVASPAASP